MASVTVRTWRRLALAVTFPTLWGTDRAEIGTTLRDPFIDYAKMAEAYGMDGEGPIEDPTLLSAALRRGVESVKRGEPYMIDVVTQPR